MFFVLLTVLNVNSDKLYCVVSNDNGSYTVHRSFDNRQEAEAHASTLPPPVAVVYAAPVDVVFGRVEVTF